MRGTAPVCATAFVARAGSVARSLSLPVPLDMALNGTVTSEDSIDPGLNPAQELLCSQVSLCV